MNEERTSSWLRQREHIRDHMWHRYSVTVNQVMVATRRRVWRYQRGNPNPYIEENQTTQWPKEKVTVTEYLCHIWSRICSLCRNHELVLSSFMNYHRVWSQSNSTESLVEQELLTLPEGLGSQTVFCGVHYAQSIDFWVVFCRSVWSFCPFYFGMWHRYSVTVNQVMVATRRRVWRYQRGNPNPYIEENQTTQWPKEKVQKTIYKTYI
jgi:hypothetical protein